MSATVKSCVLVLLVLSVSAGMLPPVALAPLPAAATDERAERVRQLQAERAGLDELIRQTQERVEKCLQDASDNDKLADEALRANPPMLTVALAYRQAARDFRDLARQLRTDILNYRQRIREIDAELRRLGG